jgi:acetoin utilization protein AcuB
MTFRRVAAHDLRSAPQQMHGLHLAPRKQTPRAASPVGRAAGEQRGRSSAFARFARGTALALVRGDAARAAGYGAKAMKAIPQVQKYMSTSPHTIGAEQTMAHAHGVLREFRIRHLPVLRGGKLAGIISERDLALIETMRDVNPAELSVEEAMSTEVYAVSPNAPLDEVVRDMAARRYGCAVVLQNQKVVGIFTAVDACQALADLLEGRLSH